MTHALCSWLRNWAWKPPARSFEISALKTQLFSRTSRCRPLRGNSWKCGGSSDAIHIKATMAHRISDHARRCLISSGNQIHWAGCAIVASLYRDDYYDQSWWGEEGIPNNKVEVIIEKPEWSAWYSRVNFPERVHKFSSISKRETNKDESDAFTDVAKWKLQEDIKAHEGTIVEMTLENGQAPKSKQASALDWSLSVLFIVEYSNEGQPGEISTPMESYTYSDIWQKRTSSVIWWIERSSGPFSYF